MNNFRRSTRKRRLKHALQRRQLQSEMLEPRQMLAADANPFHNDIRPTDINNDGGTTISDMRILLSDITTNGARELLSPLTAEGESGSNMYIDVDADGYVSPSDLRHVYNALMNPEAEPVMQMEFFMELKDTNGNPVTVATVGQTVILDVDIRDARNPLEVDPDNNNEPYWPGLNGSSDNQHIFSAYFDFAHSTNLSNASDPDEFPCDANFGGVPQGLCQYDHGDYLFLNSGNSGGGFPSVTTEINNNGTPGDPSDDFEETVINDLGGVSFNLYGDSRVNLVEIHFTVNGTNLEAVDDSVQTDETQPVSIPVLANDNITSELVFERREATGPSSEVSFLSAGNVDGDDRAIITPDEITGITSLTAPISGVALGGLTVVSTTSGTAVVGDNGTPGDTSDDVINFTPAIGGPSSATIVYSISDGIGNTDLGTVTVSIGSENDPPVHTIPQSLDGFEEQPIAFTNVSVNDIDAGQGSLTTTVTANNGTLNATVSGAPQSGTQIVINGTLTQINAALATMTFTGNQDFFGSTTASISTNDNGNTGDGGAKTTNDTININVANVNDDPIVTVPVSETVADDDVLAFNGSVTVTDIDSDNMSVSLALSSLTGPSGQIGVLTLGTTTGIDITSGANNSEFMTIQGALGAVQAALSSLSYAPDALSGFLGTVTISVVADDLDGGVDNDSFDVEVEPGVLPRARRDTLVVDEDSSNNRINVLANDLTTDNSSTAFLVQGSFTQGANGTVTLFDNGTPGDLTDDELIYTPTSNFAGTDSFTYVMDEDPSQGGVPSTGTVFVTVREGNDAPTAGDFTTTLTEDEIVSASDFANLLASLPVTPGGGSDEASQTVSVTEVTALNTGATVSTTSLTLDADFNDIISNAVNAGEAFQFRYVVTDNGTTNGSADPKTATATVTVNVTAVNDAPVGTTDGPFDATEDTPLTLSAAALVSNDAPGPATATDEAGQSVTFGGLGNTLGSQTTTSANGGTVTITGDEIVYTPATDFNGTDSFTYVVDDNESAFNVSLPIEVLIDVEAVNDSPIANEDTNDDAIKGVPLTIAISTLLANDAPGPATAIDEANQPLSITNVQSSTGNATVEIVNGNIIYTADSNFSGTDTFTYDLSDGQAVNNSDSTTVTVEVADFIPSSISGFVYIDTNISGALDANEQQLAGVTVTLTGTNLNGETITPVVVVTDADGRYSFGTLTPGSYNVTQSQPTFFIDGAESLGTFGMTSNSNDTFSLVIGAAGGVDSENNNFAELGLHPLYFSLEELRASLPSSGAVIGTNMGGDQHWFTTLGSWDSMGPNASVSATIAADMITVQITVTDGNGTTQTGTFNSATDSRVRVMGSDAAGGKVIRIEGDVDDLFAAAEAEGEPANLEQNIEMLASGRGSVADVDAVFAELG